MKDTRTLIILQDMARVQQAQNDVSDKARKCEIAILDCRQILLTLSVSRMDSARLLKMKKDAKEDLQRLEKEETQLAGEFETNQRTLGDIRENIASLIGTFNIK